MHPKMDKTRFLALNRLEYEFLRRTVDALTPAQQIQPGVTGEWSVKDILAHIVVWERRFLDWVEMAEAGEEFERPEPGYTWDEIDQLNKRDYLTNRDRAWLDVLAEFERAYHQFEGKLRALSEEALFTPGYFAFTGELALWQYAAGDGYEHFLEHAETIREWAGGQQA